MYRQFLAYKYVFRVITLAAVLGVTYSVTVLIVVVSVMEGFRSELEERIRGTTSDVRIESSVFVGLEDPLRVREIVDEIPGVLETAPTVETLALYRRLFPWESEDTDDRLLLALDVENPTSAAELDAYVGAAAELDDESTARSRILRLVRDLELPRDAATLLSHEWIESDLLRALERANTVTALRPPSDEPYLPALVGSEMLQQEPLLPGVTFELTSFSPVPPHAARTRNFVVAGYFKTGLYELDSKGIIIDLADADAFLDLRGQDDVLRVSAVRTTVAPEYHGEESLRGLRETIETRLREEGVLFVRAQTWREAKNALLQAVQMEKLIVSIILGVVILFAGFMIFIILTVQVVERRRDIGVLVSVGATARGIATAYFLIGFSLCTGGTLLGTFYGITFSNYINTIQRWVQLLTGYELFPQDVYYLDEIPVRFNPGDLLFIIVPTVAASLIASLVPAIRAAKKDPVETLRYK